MKILYIDASVRTESRTKRLAKYILNKINGEIKEINLGEVDIRPLNKEVLDFRTRLIDDKNYDNGIFSYAKDYADADLIIISAPYWDLSFPASLKNYIEAVNINGLVFRYTEDGKTEGLCKAKKLIYITTSGGKIISDEFGFGYIKTLAKNFHGIENIEYIKAEKLDIHGENIEEILQKAEKEADKIIENIRNN